jgi:NAD(P)-dependent dehydrogenase (short-subunit alcohol dehydrogenase family)
MGRAIALRLSLEGADVMGVDRNRAGLEETRERATSPLTIREADLADPDACSAVVAECVTTLGRLDILGNVAGVFLAGHATEVTREQYRHVMAVNLDACFFLAQAAIPHLLSSGGSIVNIASNSGIQGIPYGAVYSMSKGGLIQLTRSLAVEFLKTPLRVNAIAPAGTNTNIAEGVAFPQDADLGLLGRMAGVRGLAEPEEVAALFAFLASDEARSITGSIYTLDNGLTAS